MDMNLGRLLEIERDRGAWRAAVHKITEFDTVYRLNNDNSIHLREETFVNL